MDPHPMRRVRHICPHGTWCPQGFSLLGTAQAKKQVCTNCLGLDAICSDAFKDAVSRFSNNAAYALRVCHQHKAVEYLTASLRNRPFDNVHVLRRIEMLLATRSEERATLGADAAICALIVALLSANKHKNLPHIRQLIDHSSLGKLGKRVEQLINEYV